MEDTLNTCNNHFTPGVTDEEPCKFRIVLKHSLWNIRNKNLECLCYFVQYKDISFKTAETKLLAEHWGEGEGPCKLLTHFDNNTIKEGTDLQCKCNMMSTATLVLSLVVSTSSLLFSRVATYTKFCNDRDAELPTFLTTTRATNPLSSWKNEFIFFVGILCGCRKNAYLPKPFTRTLSTFFFLWLWASIHSIDYKFWQ